VKDNPGKYGLTMGWKMYKRKVKLADYALKTYFKNTI
jgi:hypothetical protein